MSDKMDRKDREAGILDDEFKVRRRLLKASAAAPLIATLSPNTALAASSVSSCAANGLDNPDPALQGLDPVTEVGDKAVRVLGTLWVKDDKVAIWEVPKGSGNFYRSDNYEAPPSGQPNSSYSSSDRYFLKYFTVLNDGGVQGAGIYPEPATGYVLAGTCLTSIAMTGDYTID